MYQQSPNYYPGRTWNGVTYEIDRLLIHWMVGSLASATNRFSNPATDVSAHWGFENGEEVQYVDEADTAFHGGAWLMNLRSIGLEHSAAPDRPASDQTYETSALRIARILRDHPAITPDRIHIIRHGEVVPTQCCGTVSPERLIARALELSGQPAPAPEPGPITPPEIIDYTLVDYVGQVTVRTTDLMVRQSPTSNSPSNQGNTADGNLHNGDVADIIGYTHAQDPYMDGRDVWLKTIRSNWIWAAGTNFDLTPAPQNIDRIITVVVDTLNVRTGPGRSYPGLVANTPDGQLHSGNTVRIISQIQGEEVEGNNLWYQSWRGNWFWSGGVV